METVSTLKSAWFLIPTRIARASVVVRVASADPGEGGGVKDRVLRGKTTRVGPACLPCSGSGSSPMPDGHLGREETFLRESHWALNAKLHVIRLAGPSTHKEWKQRLAPECPQHWCCWNQDTGQVCPSR